MSARSTAAILLANETLCLDFANTGSSDSDPLTGYHQLATWCQDQGALTQKKASQLHNSAREQPARAEGVFRKAIALRQAIYGVFSAVAAQRAINEKNLRSLNKAVAEASKHLRIVETSDGFQWQWEDAEAALELPLWLVARSAADLLTSEQHDRVRQCESADCEWLFLDRSKNRSRRWCDMAECGNREKARRSRMRKREATEA